MSWLENLLMIAGILLDVFAAMEIQGAMIAKLKKSTIIVACAVVAGLELIFYLGGYIICRLLAVNGYLENPLKYGEALAVLVLALLGVRLIVKAIKREFIQEKRILHLFWAEKTVLTFRSMSVSAVLFRL